MTVHDMLDDWLLWLLTLVNQSKQWLMSFCCCVFRWWRMGWNPLVTANGIAARFKYNKRNTPESKYCFQMQHECFQNWNWFLPFHIDFMCLWTYGRYTRYYFTLLMGNSFETWIKIYIIFGAVIFIQCICENRKRIVYLC